MRARLALAIWIGTALPAFAGGGFDIVIPGRPGVPVIINGVDASYSVVEGEWGLGKGPQVQPTVYGGRTFDPTPNVGHYYPSAGLLPGYGRLEIEPPANRRLPQPAESYHQSWSAQSTPQPVQPEVPFYPPPVILAPQQGGDAAIPQDPATPPHDLEHRKPRKSQH
ncbi:MAG: hypothetical protein QOF22_242 [Bradyrhizobium sp.]|jgi:hypothetical protein|nr:hypothetical protein [Bradyrhizobium sp.]